MSLLRKVWYESDATHDSQFDSRLHVDAAEYAVVAKRIREYRLAPDVFAAMKKRWQAQGWPLEQLENDHYGSKLLDDNDVFNLMRSFGHSIKYDAKRGGLLVLHRARNDTPTPTERALGEFIASLNVRVEKRADAAAADDERWLLASHQYSARGFERLYALQFTPEQYVARLAKWTERGWPVGLLRTDWLACKAFEDNCLFYNISFYGHKWQWDDKIGLSLMYRPRGSTTSRMTPWTEIKVHVDYCLTTENFHYFDGVAYTMNGLEHRHLWEWKTLEPSYFFPPNARPDYCYLDVIAASWEHTGLQGLGVVGGPHGHSYIELGDDEGRLYSVSQYPHPASLVNIFKQPTRQLRAALVSPDFYLSARGERTVHRIFLGRGADGRRVLGELIAFIEAMQAHYVEPSTQRVLTCAQQRHSFVDFNCSDFVLGIERLALEELGGTLMTIDDRTPMPSVRLFMLDESDSSSSSVSASASASASGVRRAPAARRSTLEGVSVRIKLFLLDCFILLLLAGACLFGRGTETINNRMFEKRVDWNELSFVEKLTKFVTAVYGSIARRLSPVQYPLRIRAEQLYSSRLSKFSRQIFQDT